MRQDGFLEMGRQGNACLALFLLVLFGSSGPGLADDPGTLANPPTLKWTTHILTADPSHILLVLPDPVHNATLLHPDDLGALFFLDGRDGRVVKELRGLPFRATEGALIIDANNDERLRELLVMHHSWGLPHLSALELEDGDLVWEWDPSEPFAGPPVLGPAGEILLLTQGGTVFALRQQGGPPIWSVPGTGNDYIRGSPTVVTVSAGYGVVAVQSATSQDPNATPRVWVAPPRVRLVLPNGSVPWELPLRIPDFFPHVTVLPVPESASVLVIDWNLDVQAPNFTAEHKGFLVRVETGEVVWNASWEGHFLGVPWSASPVPPLPTLLETAVGPVALAPLFTDRLLRLWPANGTVHEVESECEGILGVPFDFEGDGRPELLGTFQNLAGDETGVCVLSAPDGVRLWNQTLERSYRGDPVLGDVDGDGLPELLTLSDFQGLTVDAFDLTVPTAARKPGILWATVAFLAATAVGTFLGFGWLWRRMGRSRQNTPESKQGIPPKAPP